MTTLAIVHQSLMNLSADERDWQAQVCSLRPEHTWLVRNYLEHPADPGWEAGIYCQCHRAFRQKVRQDDLVVDTVNVRGSHRVRSAFYVKEKRDCPVVEGPDLLFSEYYFVRSTPYIISSRFNRAEANNGKVIDTKSLLKALNEPTRYELLREGQKPELLPETCWEILARKGKAARGTSDDHSCT